MHLVEEEDGEGGWEVEQAVVGRGGGQAAEQEGCSVVRGMVLVMMNGIVGYGIGVLEGGCGQEDCAGCGSHKAEERRAGQEDSRLVRVMGYCEEQLCCQVRGVVVAVLLLLLLLLLLWKNRHYSLQQCLRG